MWLRLEPSSIESLYETRRDMERLRPWRWFVMCANYYADGKRLGDGVADTNPHGHSQRPYSREAESAVQAFVLDGDHAIMVRVAQFLANVTYAPGDLSKFVF